jgi:glycerate kinase
MSAINVAEAIRSGMKNVFPSAEFDLVPMADGGEGTVEAMMAAMHGRLKHVTVKGPLGETVEASYALVENDKTAVIEMASASGLPLVRPEKRNPMFTTTFGTGELIRSALGEGVKKIILGIGGSATVDGGAGMAMAMGAKLLDAKGQSINLGGRGLKDLHHIDMSEFDSRIIDTEILVASDVDNPLTGAHGAAVVFGPQKGATPEMVGALDQNLHHLAEIMRSQLGIDIEHAPGAGAAGGLGAALLAFCKAKLVSGSKLIAQTVSLEKRIIGTDLCVTGEGKIDGQSVRGKVCFEVASLAKKQNVPVIALVGSIGYGAEVMIPPLTAYFSLINKPMELQEAIHLAEPLLTNLAENIARAISIRLSV